jgi:alpha-mannosidase
VHDERRLIEGRIERELVQRIRPAALVKVGDVTVEANHLVGEPVAFETAVAGEFEPFRVGDPWGAPWRTTWFRLSGMTPDDVSNMELVADIGFDGDYPGYQAEGLLFDRSGRALQGLHPRRASAPLEGVGAGQEFVRYIEAAANPRLVDDGFVPWPHGRWSTAPTAPIYRLNSAHLARRDETVYALAIEIDLLLGVARQLATDDPRRWHLITALGRSLDRLNLHDVSAGATEARAELVAVLDDPARSSALRLVAVGHAHIDTAWVWPLRETIRKCRRTFTSAVDMMDRHPDFSFVCSQAAQYEMVARTDPALFERIASHVRGGQWIPIGGMWVESDVNLPSGESLVRQFVHGQRAFESWFGHRSSVAWLPDVFGYPASLPQILRLAGCNRFVTQKISWNSTNRFPHHTFDWVGIDGTSVLTHFPSVDTYVSEMSPADLAHAERNFAEHGWSRSSLVPYGYGDGGGGPTREMLEFARRAHSLDGLPKVELGTVEGFFETVESELSAGATAPRWVGELYLEAHRGTFTSQLRTKEGNRRCEQLLREVELLAALNPVDVELLAQLDRWWKDVLVLQFHDVLPGTSIGWVHDEAEATYERIADEVGQAIVRQLQAAAPEGGVAVNVRTHDAEEVVITDVGGVGGQVLADGRTGRWVRAASLGITPLAPVRRSETTVAGHSTMSNDAITVRHDGSEVVSIVDRHHAREFLCAPIGLELAPDHPAKFDAWDLDRWTRDRSQRLLPERLELLDSGPLVAQSRATYHFGSSTARLTYRLTAGATRLEIDVDVEWAEREQLLSLVLPLDVHAEFASCGIQFGQVVRPTHRSDSWDDAKFEVCAHRWVDLSEPSFGVAVLDSGRYGHAFDGSTVRVSLVRGPLHPDPEADLGRHRVTVALLAHGPSKAEVIAQAEALAHPIRVVDGVAPIAGRSLSVAGPGVEIDAVKPADDGSGDIIVRLHEAFGDRSSVMFRDVVEAERTDIFEVPQEPIIVVDGNATIALKPFEIVTARLRRRSPPLG